MGLLTWKVFLHPVDFYVVVYKLYVVIFLGVKVHYIFE